VIAELNRSTLARRRSPIPLCERLRRRHVVLIRASGGDPLWDSPSSLLACVA
jgi:hypothetical protein